jgi:hypothetical protein
MVYLYLVVHFYILLPLKTYPYDLFNLIPFYLLIKSKKYKTNDAICRWCDNNFEESGKKDPETEFKDGVLCCPRCGNITYGFLVYKNGQ